MRTPRGTAIILYAALAILGLTVWTCSAFGQSVQYGLVIGPARDTMVAAWNTKLEQAYCVKRDTVFIMEDTKVDSLTVVGIVYHAKTFMAAHDSVQYECPTGAASVHTHPGMPEQKIVDCNPSRDDWLALDKSHARYNILQCNATAFVFFFESMNPLHSQPHTLFYAPGAKKP